MFDIYQKDFRINESQVIQESREFYVVLYV